MTQPDLLALIELPDPWLAAATDLLTHPRHSLTPKDRKWLEGEVRRFAREAKVRPLARLP